MPRRSFEEVVLPHLDAAFNYARWLTKNEADAEDVVQDASVRALRFFSSLRGEDARAWLLTIVRNTCDRKTSRCGFYRHLRIRCGLKRASVAIRSLTWRR
jgi:DNA-directed RNA polymerase specialized sigma24 family protein